MNARAQTSWLMLVVMATIAVQAQRRGGPPSAPPTAKAQAPIDLTGYWVSIVNEDWRYRMTTPPKGDYAGVPLNAIGRQAADAWDPARDQQSGGACRAYGAGGVMRMPGRLHITWRDADTLILETDAGAQTRTFSFRSPSGQAGDWQGVSTTSWDRSDSAMARGGFFPGAAVRGGSLKVVTTGMKPGYLRKNGVPYSGDAVMTEYFDRFDLPNGDSWIVVSTELVDPMYLTTPFWTSTHFRNQRDASGWNPKPCSIR